MTDLLEEVIVQRVSCSLAKLRELLVAQRSGSWTEAHTASLAWVIDELSDCTQEWSEILEDRSVELENALSVAQALSFELDSGRALMDLVPDALAVTDDKGMIRQANLSLVNLLGTRNLLLDRPLSAYVAREQAREFYMHLSRIASGELEVIRDWELKMISRGGDNLDVLVSVTRSRAPDGSTQELYWQFKDISERKRMEAELAAKANELAKANEDLEHFAYVVAHDLQQPARIAATHAQLLARIMGEKLDPEARQEVSYIVDAAKKMVELIREVLAYSQITGQQDRLEPVDAAKVAGEAVALLEANIKESGATVKIGPLPVVMARTTSLRQVFENLIANAIKFRGSEPPVVCVYAKRDGREWTFAIRDNGIGIEEPYREKIFAMFQRVHTDGRYEGTGVGLATCRRIIESYGGKIWVTSAPGLGSTFYFTLQAAQRNARPPRSRRKGAPLAPDAVQGLA
ncbi:MAG TPA: ATP-binding protein [Candidatus Obscuribacterales bacterium]